MLTADDRPCTDGAGDGDGGHPADVVEPAAAEGEAGLELVDLGLLTGRGRGRERGGAVAVVDRVAAVAVAHVPEGGVQVVAVAAAAAGGCGGVALDHHTWHLCWRWMI